MSQYEPPNPWELVLGEIRGVNARIDKLVTTDMFAAEQKRMDEHIARLGRELASEKSSRESADKDERKARTDFVADYEKARKDDEKYQRDNRARWYLALIGLIAAPFISAWVQSMIMGGR